MKQAKQIAVILLLAFISIVPNGCGGGGDSSSGNAPTILEGNFLDSAVEGLRFVSGNQSGTTDLEGLFSYVEGSTVQFYVGDILIGEIAGQSIITPVDLVASATDENNSTVINICRFLMTLDNDGDPGNGITIREEVRNNAAGMVIDFGQSTDAFEDDPNVINIVNQLTALNDAGVRGLYTEVEAEDHLRSTLVDILSGTYAGTYEGNISSFGIGDVSGIWTVVGAVDGNVSGVAILPDANLTCYDVTGTVYSNGAIVITSGLAGGATYTGTISSVGNVTGTWSLDALTGSGTFSGGKTFLSTDTDSSGRWNFDSSSGDSGVAFVSQNGSNLSGVAVLDNGAEGSLTGTVNGNIATWNIDWGGVNAVSQNTVLTLTGDSAAGNWTETDGDSGTFDATRVSSLSCS